MKRLISAQTVEQAAQRGEDICIDDNTIVTPQACDLAKELGVLLNKNGADDKAAYTHHEGGTTATCTSHEECGTTSCTSHEACTTAPRAQHEACASTSCSDKKPALSADEMEHIIRAALDKGIWTEQRLCELLGGCK